MLNIESTLIVVPEKMSDFFTDISSFSDLNPKNL